MASGKSELQLHIVRALEESGYSPDPIGFEGSIPKDTSVFDMKKILARGRKAIPFWKPCITKDTNDGRAVQIFEMNVPE